MASSCTWLYRVPDALQIMYLQWWPIPIPWCTCKAHALDLLNVTYKKKQISLFLYSIVAFLFIALFSRVTLYTAGHLHTAVPHCSHSRAPIVHTAVPRENNEHGCVCLRCRAVCNLPGCVEGHPWFCNWNINSAYNSDVPWSSFVQVSASYLFDVSGPFY